MDVSMTVGVTRVKTHAIQGSVDHAGTLVSVCSMECNKHSI